MPAGVQVMLSRGLDRLLALQWKQLSPKAHGE